MATEVAVERGFALWLQYMFARRGRLIALVSTLSSIVTLVVGTIAMRVVDPQKDIRRVEIKVDTTIARVLRLESAVTEGSNDRAEIKAILRTLVYMQCVSTRRTDPAALPDICTGTRRVP